MTLAIFAAGWVLGVMSAIAAYWVTAWVVGGLDGERR